MMLKTIPTATAIAFLLTSCESPGTFVVSAQGRPEVRFVAVEPLVQLEVLDWGGQGRAIVLLAGSGNTAHVFDELAPKLAERWRTYAITRRGFGASSRPASGYDDQRLADDVLRVLDVLRIESPVLVGHSMAGGELTTIGSQHPTRIRGLVYLDAIADPADATGNDATLMAVYKRLPPTTRLPPVRTSFAAYRASQLSNTRWAFPESELRQLYIENPDGSVGPYRGSISAVHSAIGEGQKKRDYSRIRVPILALSTFACSASNGGNDGCITHANDRLKYEPRDVAERAVVEQFESLEAAYIRRWKANIRDTAAKRVRLVDIPGAAHHVFLSHEEDVIREISEFLTVP
jgi:pimeloyl-ACP methyl ester carboxylesterase